MKVTHILCLWVSETLPLSSSQECFNSPYGTQYFADYAEPIPGTSTECLSSVAKECKIYLIGGEDFVFHSHADLYSRFCAWRWGLCFKKDMFKLGVSHDCTPETIKPPFMFFHVDFSLGDQSGFNLYYHDRSICKLPLSNFGMWCCLHDFVLSPLGVQYVLVVSLYIDWWVVVMLLLCPGSTPEQDGDKLYNTCTVFSPTGTMLGKYRKVSVYACDLCSLVLSSSFFFLAVIWTTYMTCICYSACCSIFASK